MGKARHYTDEQFADAVKTSFSIRQVLHLLGLKEAGGNYKVAKARIEYLQLNISHFTGQGHLKGKTNNWHPKIPLEKILVENSTYTSTHKLKQRLIKEGHFEEKCYNCGAKDWLGKHLSLELEHINGKNNDHRKENITLLCPNCHSLTPTYRGKKKKK